MGAAAFRTNRRTTRAFWSVHRAYQDKRRPKAGVSKPPAASQHGPLRQGQRGSFVALAEVATKALHEFGGGLVIDFPEAGEHGGRAGKEECSRQADEIFPCWHVGEVAAAQRGVAGAERDQGGAQTQAQDLVNLKPAVVRPVRLQIDARE